MENNRKGNGIFLGIVSVSTLIVAIIGATFGMLLDPISDKRHKQLSKKKNEMFKTVGAAIDNIMDMF